MNIKYTDPFTEGTQRKSVTWHHLRNEYRLYRIDLSVANEIIEIASVQRNQEDGGKWRWDTPLFDKEVTTLIERINSTDIFEAVWLRKQDGVYTLLDGHHRLVAWQRMGNLTVPAVVITVKPHVPKFRL